MVLSTSDRIFGRILIVDFHASVSHMSLWQVRVNVNSEFISIPLHSLKSSFAESIESGFTQVKFDKRLKRFILFEKGFSFASEHLYLLADFVLEFN